jgi:hypothetical protein
MLSLELGDPGECSRHAEQPRVARVNPGDQRIGKDLRGFGTGPPGDEVVDLFIASFGARRPEALGKQRELRPPAE